MALPQIEMLETLARQLHQEVKRHGVQAARDFFNNCIFPARRSCSELSYSLHNNKKLLSLFTTVCEKMNLFSSSAVSYMTAVHSVEDLIVDPNFLCTLRLLDNTSAARFLEYAQKKKAWMFALTILLEKPRMIKPGCMDTEALIDMVEYFIEERNVPLFEFVVKHNLLSLSEVIQIGPRSLFRSQSAVLSVLSMIMQSLKRLGPEAEEIKGVNRMLYTAIATGVSTYHANLTSQHGRENVMSPLEIAVVEGRLDIVRLLYRTGATTNAELFHYKSRIDDFEAEEVQTPDEIDRYVCHAAQQPRRLQDLCSLRISHCIGCRDMDSRAEAVNKIPEKGAQEPPEQAEDDRRTPYILRDRVLSVEALVDFLKETAHYAKARDPPGVWCAELKNISSESTASFVSEERAAD